MNLVDTHCHLDFDQYDDDREEVLTRCGEEMAAVIVSGTNAERNTAALQLAEDNGVVHATLGFHPTYVKDGADLDRIEQQIRDKQGAIVGVGEIGLDYHHVSETEWREKQEGIFRRFLELAEELDLPAVLHTRDAEKPSLEIVEQYEPPQVAMHCFNGAPSLAERALDNGYYVSISTQVLYSNRVHELAEIVPLDRILLETDAPFLYQGERNVPWNVAESAETIADIKDAEPEEVAERTTDNARTVFGF